MRGVRAVPAALPDVPGHRARERCRRAVASPRCARSSSTARRSTTRSRGTMESACSAAAARRRARRPCRSATSWRARGAALDEHRRRADDRARPARRRVGRATALVLPRHRLLLALTWLLLGRAAPAPRAAAVRAAAPRCDPLARRRSIADAGDRPTRSCSPGCVMDAWQRDVHRAALQRHARPTGARVGAARARRRLLRRAARARRPDRRGPRVWPGGSIASMPGDAPVVVDSAGCGAAMKDYGRLLGTPEAQAFAARVATSPSGSRAADRRSPLATPARTVVVQDPCHLRHVQKAHGAVRTVLAPAYRLGRAPTTTGCAAAPAARTRVLEPELVGDDPRPQGRRDPARPAAADPLVVVSANPGCAMHLAAAGLDVRHPAELLAEALDAEPTDRCRRARRAAPDGRGALRDLAYDRLRRPRPTVTTDAAADEKRSPPGPPGGRAGDPRARRRAPEASSSDRTRSVRSPALGELLVRPSIEPAQRAVEPVDQHAQAGSRGGRTGTRCARDRGGRRRRSSAGVGRDAARSRPRTTMSANSVVERRERSRRRARAAGGARGGRRRTAASGSWRRSRGPRRRRRSTSSVISTSRGRRATM